MRHPHQLNRLPSLVRSDRLSVAVNKKKSPSRLQRISKQLKLSGKFLYQNIDLCFHLRFWGESYCAPPFYLFDYFTRWNFFPIELM